MENTANYDTSTPHTPAAIDAIMAQIDRVIAAAQNPAETDYSPALEPRLPPGASASALSDRLAELKTVALELRAAARQAGGATDDILETLELTLADITAYQQQADRDITQDANLIDHGICLSLRQAAADLRRRANPTDTAGDPTMPDEYRGFSLFVHNLTEAQYRHLLNRYESGQAVAVHDHCVAYLSDCEDYYYQLLVEDIINTCQSKGALPPNDAEDDPEQHREFIYAPPSESAEYVCTLRPWDDLTDRERYEFAKICVTTRDTPHSGKYSVTLNSRVNLLNAVITPFCTRQQVETADHPRAAAEEAPI